MCFQQAPDVYSWFRVHHVSVVALNRRTLDGETYRLWEDGGVSGFQFVVMGSHITQRCTITGP